MPILQTARLTLTPSVPADAADLMALERDPDVMRYLNGGYAVDHAHDNSNATFLMPRGTEDYVWTARYTSNNAFVGWFCLWPDSETIAELGYRLNRANWGQGLAAEGALALINWGFANCGYNRIFASTMAVNIGSRRVWKKSGCITRAPPTTNGLTRFPAASMAKLNMR
jgi:RimJ/RimL family protein N-acetyltransferase